MVMTQKRKNKKQLSVQKDDPIPFPHDGCIYHALQQDGTTNSLQPAAELLQVLPKDESSRSMHLLHVLKTASSIKEQLQALHSFKSWVLQQQGDESVLQEASFLYRLLLEWMLSSGTPLPLRKALQSTLSILPSGTVNEDVYESLLESVTSSTPCWKDPVSALPEALSWMTVTPVVQVQTLNVLLCFAQKNTIGLLETKNLLDQSYMNQVYDSLTLVSVVKMILENVSLQDEMVRPVAKKWIPFLYQLLACRAVPTDRLPIVSVAYARAIVMQHDGTTNNILVRPDLASLTLRLPQIVLIQGLVAAVVWEELEPQLLPIMECLEAAALKSSDLQVRIMALKTLRTVVSRCASHDTKVPCDLMEIVLESWENPPCRKLAQAVAALFQALIKIHPREELPALVDRIMEQPPHRKGKYIALEAVLPLVGRTVSPALLSELLVGISDQGHNRGTIANLWQTLLNRDMEWVPSLANALVTIQPFSSRQQIAAFCLPRIQDVPEGPIELLRELFKYSITEDRARDADRLTLSDRVMWAKLEVVRLSTKPDPAFQILVASSFSLPHLKSAVTHISPQMRLATLRCLRQVLSCHNLPNDGIPVEMQILKYMLPYAVKTSGKEYVSSLLESVVLFIDRFMLSEQSSGVFPLTESFVVDFLLNDMIHFLGYPGTVQDKETFLLSMLESLLLFSARDTKLPGLDKKLVAKRGAVWTRSHSNAEKECLLKIRKALVETEVFAALFSILHSRWDGSRANAYKVLTGVISLAQSCEDLELPVDLCEKSARVALFDRALQLASSPRQREADSGARMLAIVCQSMSTFAEKYRFMTDTVNLLDVRLDEMKSELDAIVANTQSDGRGSKLPLSHGIIQALHLIIENDTTLADNLGTDKELLLERLANVLSKGIRTSLAVVADLNDDKSFEEIEDDLPTCNGFPLTSDQSGISVNPGALGANGIFSSITRVSREEDQKRLTSQRIVMGSWLLTREACGAIAVAFGVRGYTAPASLLNSCATLLINTLTSLKHVGAAFAAHQAVETLAQICFRCCHDKTIEQLPKSWAHRLLDETELDRVRDSTLRRSTGYALGFLSIMRAEIASGSHLRPLCGHILSVIVQLSLPTPDRMLGFTKTIGLNGPEEMFSYLGSDQWQSQSEHKLKTRIHALNVLRMIILDAPLAKEIYPIIGDAIVSSVMGYTDLDWTVRNSSTMIFAAIMLRSIDADKNANSNTAGRKATSLIELVRAYPLLLKFLLAVLKTSINGVLKTDKSMSLPPVLPILLLFARLQAVSQCGPDAVSLVEPFLPFVLRALEHPEIAIRNAAARALSNISSHESESPTNARVLFIGFQMAINDCVATFGSEKGFHWNRLHGVLEASRTLMNKSSKEMGIAKEILAPNPFFAASWIINGMPVIPPTCLSVAIDLLVGLLPSSTCTSDRCDEVNRWLELRMSSYYSGAGELGLKFGHLTACHLAEGLWDAKNWDDVETLLPKLKGALTCPSIDFRLSAVKAFKKSIYAGLDKTVETCEHALSLIHALTLVLASSLSSECQDPFACHYPTLRRLSRCLLECLDSASRLGTLEGLLALIRTDVETFFNIILTDDVVDDSKTQAFGNAIELYGFFVGFQLTAPQHFDLEQLLKLASDPNGFWRVRHSAASAMARGRRPLFNTSVDSRQLVDISTWMELIQDFDEDVRFAAAKFAYDVEIPEISLSRLILGSQPFRDQGARVSFVFELSESLSRDALENIRNVNVDDSNRKIFEEEDHNSYMERFIPFHLAVATCDGIRFSLPDECRATATLLIQRCRQVLSHWIQVKDADHSLYFSASRKPSLFLPIHALLVGCILVIKSSEDADFAPEFRKHAEELCRKDSTHPYIRKALSILAQVQSNDGIMLSNTCVLSHTLN